MKTLISFVTILSMLIINHTVYGNTGVFFGAGNQVVPIKNNAIRLVREEVDINLTVDKDSGRFGVPFIPWANVSATFYFRNNTKSDVSMQMGFPFLDLQGFGDEKYVLDNLNFKVTSDNHEIGTELKEGVIEKEFDPRGLFKKVFTWNASFRPSEEKIFRVSYRMLMGVASANSVMRDFDDIGRKYSSFDELIQALSYNFSYITKTAYTWAGSIEEAVFKIDCSALYENLTRYNFLAALGMSDPGYDRPLFWDSTSPASVKTGKGSYIWTFSNKVPEEGLAYYCMGLFMPSRPDELIQYKSISMAKLKDITSEEFKSILKAYYQILAFDKKPTDTFTKNYFEAIVFLDMPKNYILDRDKVSIEEIANNFDDYIQK